MAALRSDRGASRQLLLGALRGRFATPVSVPLMFEYQSVLARPEHLEAGRVWGETGSGGNRVSLN